MTPQEFKRWLLFRQKWGVSLLLSGERNAALVAQSIRGGKMEDYLPNREPKKPATETEIVQAFNATVKKRR
ncbi:MAG: hypothetical protein RSE94_03030 [Pseudomonas sp.]